MKISNGTNFYNLKIKCDDNEQYYQRSCLRIHGLDFNSDVDKNMYRKK